MNKRIKASFKESNIGLSVMTQNYKPSYTGEFKFEDSLYKNVSKTLSQKQARRHGGTCMQSWPHTGLR
jgi:hypothetical protein